MSFPGSQGAPWPRLLVQVMISLGSEGCFAIWETPAYPPAAGPEGSGGRLFLHLVLFCLFDSVSHPTPRHTPYTPLSRFPNLSRSLVLARGCPCATAPGLDDILPDQGLRHTGGTTSPERGRSPYAGVRGGCTAISHVCILFEELMVGVELTGFFLD